jgi:hypothetical protein
MLEIYLRDLAPLEQALCDAGYAIRQVYELKESKTVYKKAIPIILNWLPHIKDIQVKGDVIDVLAVPWAKPNVAPVLIHEFLAAPDVPEPMHKIRIAEALRIIADKEVYDDMVAIFRDKRHGGYRVPLGEAIGSMKMPGAVDVLIEMLDDDVVAGYAIMGLRKLKDPKSRPYLERFLNHEMTWVRKEAAKTIEGIDKKIEREKQKMLDKKEK